jgi:rRNA-processing protein FCF1
MTAKPSGSRSAARRSKPSARPAVVLDTNLLFLTVRAGFPLEQEVERLFPGARLLVPASVVAELEGLARSLTPGAMAARALAARYEIVPTQARGDDGVIEAAASTGAGVATADRELRRRLGVRGITILTPRDRHRLEVVRARAASVRPPRTRRGASPGGNG